MPRGVSSFDAMWLRSKEEEVRARHEEALAALESGDLDGARRIAEELKAMRWSGAYEVLALAARAENDLDGAVRILDEGCALAAEAWGLHELRGTLLDALGRHVDAMAAYDQALACEGVWAASVRYNRAIARWRYGDPGGALADVEAVLGGASAPPFALDAIRLGIDALDKLGRRDDAVSLVRTALAEASAGTDVAARLEGLLAVALARAGELDAARDAARVAIEAGHGTAALAQLMPPIAHDDRPARWLRVIVQGRARAGERPLGFLRVLAVLAADANEALLWASQLEPEAERETLEIDECKDNDAPPPPEGTPRGIVGASARIAFDES